MSEKPDLMVLLAAHDLEELAAPWETTTLRDLVGSDVHGEE